MRLAILGAGPGGYVAAIRAAQLGAQVTVIEDREVGGTCLNWGCIPTKTLIASAELLAHARQLSTFGIDFEGNISPNLAKIIERKNRVVSTQVKGVRALFKSWGVTLREGRGALSSPKEIAVALRDGSTETVSADSIIIATGSRPAVIPAVPFDGTHIISSTEALDLTVLPRSILIVGAGVMGCEFACIFREFGSEVTIVELQNRAVATEDEDVSEVLEREFRKKKIRLLTGSSIVRSEVQGDGVHVFLSDGAELVVEKVIVSVGRAFNSGGIGLETVGVATGGRGEITVNVRMETSVPGIYAVGDVTGGPLLAHVASAQGIVAAKNAVGRAAAMDYSVVPTTVFTTPEIASVGLREHQAREQGLRYRTGTIQYRALGKPHAMGEIAGLCKVIADEATDRLLGAHIIGAHAADLIHELALALRTGRTVREIAGTIHAHPTLAEVVREAAEALHGEAVHVPRP